MQIQQIRNATIVLYYSGKRFLVDPWLQKKGTGFIAPTPYPEKNIPSPTAELPISVSEILRNTDAIIVTHIHPDHFDTETAQMLDKSIPVFVQNENDKIKIESMGYKKVYIIKKNGTEFFNIRLTRTQGMHGISPTQNAGSVCGVIFSAINEKKLYIAGDTIFYDGVKKELDLHKPNIIILNACGAEIINIGRLIMDAKDVYSVCKAAPYATVIVSHMEAVNHATITRSELRDYTFKHGISEQVLIPSDGEAMIF